MNFLTPEALVFAATLPGRRCLLSLKRRRVARLVSSTFFGSAFSTRLRPVRRSRNYGTTGAGIQLVLLALAVFALTRPYFAGNLEGTLFYRPHSRRVGIDAGDRCFAQ
ncbi:MAG: hypothetical protein Ct9H300mP32_5150 [Verrucomicrobiota bacterium]|nr:MAG: hypothetical protein Ct9H300mP32_5150 [Verrucomicrobiota bacterium]